MAEPDLMNMIFGAAPTATPFDKDSVAQAQELAAAAPPAPRPLRLPFNERPWHEQFQDVTGTHPVGGARTFYENAGDQAIANTADEAGAELIVPDAVSSSVQPSAELYGPERIQGYDSPLPTAIPAEHQKTFAAGSEKEDVRRTLETEKRERDAENPTLALAGRATGGMAQGALVPGGPVAQTVGGAALTAANMIGEGHGDLGERTDQAIETAKEHPYMTALGVAAPAVAPGIAKGAGAIANKLQRGANRNTVAAFTTPGQRNALIDNLGPNAVDDLGANARRMKLDEMPWYEFWRSPNAETFYNNAVKARKAAEAGLEETESTIAKAGGDPNVNYTPVAEDLEGAADEVMKRANKTSAGKEAALLREQATHLRNATKRQPHGPAQAFYEDQPFTSKGGAREFEAAEAVEQPFTTKGGTRNFVEESQEAVDPGFTSKGGPRNFVEESVESVDPGFTSKGGPRNFVDDSQEAVQPPFFPSGAGRQAPPHVEAPDWFDYLKRAEADPATPLPPTKPGGMFEGPDRLPEFQAGPSKTFTAEGPELAPEFRAGPKQKFTAEGPDRLPEFEAGPQKTFTAEGPDRAIEALGQRKQFTAEGPDQAPNVTETPPAEIETGVNPFTEAQADLRHYNRDINFLQQGGPENAPVQQQVYRRLGTKLRGQIHEGLDDAVGRGQLEGDVVKDWKGHKKDYATAASVEDPAQALMQKDYGGSMGLKDLAGASLFSQFGLGGPAAMTATKAMQGRWPAWRANRLQGMANEFGAVENLAKDATENAGMIRGAATPHPVAAAQQENPDAPKATIIEQASTALKQQLQDALKEGTDWFRSLIP